MLLLVANLAVNFTKGIAPGMNLRDLADGSGLHHFHKLADAVGRVPLVAHLRDDLLVQRRLAHGSDFGHRVGERLFAVNMFAMTDRRERRHRVGVVRRADEHSIKIVRHFIEHLPEILESFGFGEPVEVIRRATLIHIAQGHDVLARHGTEVRPSLTTTANHCQPDLVGRSLRIALGTHDMGGDKLKSEGGGCGGGNKGSAFHNGVNESEKKSLIINGIVSCNFGLLSQRPPPPRCRGETGSLIALQAR